MKLKVKTAIVILVEGLHPAKEITFPLLQEAILVTSPPLDFYW